MFNPAVVLAVTLPVAVMHAPHADLKLEVARTEPQREHGLMNRTTVSPHTGMIFVFEHDGPVAFWMKNTLVSLDMVFLGADGTVRHVFSNVPVVAPTLPDEAIPREEANAKYVIELHAGEAVQDGIVKGTKLDVHALPPGAPDETTTGP